MQCSCKQSKWQSLAESAEVRCHDQEESLLHSALVKPHLEYCIQFWVWHFRKDVDKPEGIWRTSSKMIRAWKKNLRRTVGSTRYVWPGEEKIMGMWQQVSQ